MLRMKMASAKMYASWAHVFYNLLKMAVAPWSFIHLGGVLQGVHAAGQLFLGATTSTTTTSSAKSLQVETMAGSLDKENYSRGSKDSLLLSPHASAVTGTGRLDWEDNTSDEDMASNVGADLSLAGTGRMASHSNVDAILEAMNEGSQEVERSQTCRESEKRLGGLPLGLPQPGFLCVQDHLHGETARSPSQQQELQTPSRTVRRRLSTPGLAAVPTSEEKSRLLPFFYEHRPHMLLLSEFLNPSDRLALCQVAQQCCGRKDETADAENQGNQHEDLHQDGPQGHVLQLDGHDLEDHGGQVLGLHVQQDDLQDFETVRCREAALFCDDVGQRLGLKGAIPEQGPAYLPGNPPRAIFASDGKALHPDGKRMKFEDAAALPPSGQPVFYRRESSPFASYGSGLSASSPFSSAPPLPFGSGSSPFLSTPFPSSSSTAAIAEAAVYGPTSASLNTLMSLADQQQKRWEEESRSCMLGQDQASYASQAHGASSWSSSSSAPSTSQCPPAVAGGSAALFISQEQQKCFEEKFLRLMGA
ncbi:unnamed protein product [Amoebophrya sp. A25]|nr:unnamed protein product [Amoebophrya sp. A25]|eukprot:GSA25T00004187001.1